jgi:hypothetical protein
VKGAHSRIPEEAEDPGQDTVMALVHRDGEEEGSSGSQSPPIDCTGVGLINSEPRRTM